MLVHEARDRIRGCLLAGAVGDALGAPIEFDSLSRIRERCGPDGVTGYLPAYGLEGGAITDDTQMTLFTAEGLIRAYVRSSHRGIGHPPSVVRYAYLRWLATQGETSRTRPVAPLDEDGWLVTVEGLHRRRAPGNTCLSAMRSAEVGTIEEPLNDSKGCGGVMRVAPVGLVTGVDPFVLGVECAALTHGHPSGYLAAGFFAMVVASLFEGASLEESIDGATRRLRGEPNSTEVLDAIDAARRVASGGRPTPEQLETLGGGWVAEEALAIALCCALVAEDLRDGLLLAVNHSGDSDSTGSMVGNLLGVMHGESAIPPELLGGLELRDVITEVADDLADAFYGAGVGGEYEERTAHVERVWARYPGY